MRKSTTTYIQEIRNDKNIECLNNSYCSKVTRYSTDDIKLMAHKRNIIFLSNYNNMMTQCIWQCMLCNHKWQTTVNHIKNMGTGCPKCVNKNRPRPLTTNIQDARRIAKQAGFKFISSIFHGMKKKHEWQCKNGHVWETTPTHIKGGNKCPTCSRNRRTKKCRFITERLVRSIFEQLTSKKFPSDWHTLGNGQQLDGYCPELKIAFEYNGPQHYHTTPYWNTTNDELKKQQERDNRKTTLCNSLGIIKIDVPYSVAKPAKRLEKFIKMELSKRL